MEHEQHDHDLGLAHDMSILLGRRRTLALLAGVGLVALVGCGSDSGETAGTTATTTGDTAGGSATTATTTATTATTATTGSAACTTIPEETAGPFPGDGSNGPDVLAESGVVRSDITASVGSASGVAEGVPLTVNLAVVDTASGCAPLAGAAIYIWHCDREGRYSMYSPGVTEENYLRGVQEADSDGRLTFTTIFPGAYAGRWPHIHFEVYPSLDEATSAGNPLATSQIALPEDTCDAVYAMSGYEQSVQNMTQLSLATDMVFRDGVSQQTPTVSGAAGSDLTIELTVAV